MKISSQFFLALFVTLMLAVPITAQTATVPCAYAQIDRTVFGADDAFRLFMIPSFTANCGTVEFDAAGGMYNPVVVKILSDGSLVKEVPARFYFGGERRMKVGELSVDELPDGNYIAEVYVGGEPTPSTKLAFSVAKGGDPVTTLEPRSKPQYPEWAASPVMKMAGRLYVRMRAANGAVSGYLYQTRTDRTVVVPVSFGQVSKDQGFFLNWAAYRGSLIDDPWMRTTTPIPTNSVFQDGIPVFFSATTAEGVTVQGLLVGGAGTGTVNFEGWNR